MVRVNTESCSTHTMLKQNIGFVEVGVEMQYENENHHYILKYKLHFCVQKKML